jgi:hypothetical protein
VTRDYKYKHPRAGARGRFGTPRGDLRGVLGWYPLVPVLIQRVRVVGRPEVRPEPYLLLCGCAGPDDDAQRFGLLDWGNG